MADPLTAELDRIARELRTFGANGQDTARLLAAVEVILAYHRPFDRQERVGTSRRCRTCAGLPEWPCAQYKAIVSALTGQE